MPDKETGSFGRSGDGFETFRDDDGGFTTKASASAGIVLAHIHDHWRARSMPDYHDRNITQRTRNRDVFVAALVRAWKEERQAFRMPVHRLTAAATKTLVIDASVTATVRSWTLFEVVHDLTVAATLFVK